MEETVGQARQKLALALIEGAARLVDLYGYWPSFHDAEVLSKGVDDMRGQAAYPFLR